MLGKRNARISKQTGQIQMFNSQKSTLNVKLNIYIYIYIYIYICYAKSLQLCLTLCDPIDGSPPASPIPGILQARTLEWVDISFSNA